MEVGVPDSAESVHCWVPDSAGLAATGSGPLDGVTVAVKDMFAVAGRVSSFGHPAWRASHEPAEATAPAVARLLAAGASAAGLAKLDQLAYSIIGNAGEGTPPVNSRYPDRFTCGSSCGPAAAVAAGLADLGLGTDTGGSVRAPAAACGLYGLRPTHGLISAEGILPLAPSFDTAGVMAGRLDLLGRALGVLAPAPPPAVPIRRVLLPADVLAGASTETAQAVRAVAAALAAATGGELAECELGSFISDEVADLFSRLQAREVWATHAAWLREHRGVLAADVRARADRAERLSADPADRQQADQRAGQEYRAGLDQAAPPDTVVVLPVMPGLPPLRAASPEELGQFRLNAFRFTAPASLAGRPELVIPVRHQASGLGLGVGLLSARGQDPELLRVAGRLGPGNGLLAV
jgi:amidase